MGVCSEILADFPRTFNGCKSSFLKKLWSLKREWISEWYEATEWSLRKPFWETTSSFWAWSLSFEHARGSDKHNNIFVFKVRFLGRPANANESFSWRNLPFVQYGDVLVASQTRHLGVATLGPRISGARTFPLPSHERTAGTNDPRRSGSRARQVMIPLKERTLHVCNYCRPYLLTWSVWERCYERDAEWRWTLATSLRALGRRAQSNRWAHGVSLFIQICKICKIIVI